ncbi:hypothetical protein QTP88_025135 [Uroleucon formosanum]
MQKDGLGNIMLKCVELFQQIILNTLKETKYRSAHVEAKRLASLASEATGKQFEQRLMILKYIANAWEQDKNITTTEIGLDNIDANMKIEEVEKNNAIQIDANMEIIEIEEDDVIQIDNLEDNLPHLPPIVPKRG